MYIYVYTYMYIYVSILTILKDLVKPCKTCLASQNKQMEVCSRLCLSVSECDWL